MFSFEKDRSDGGHIFLDPNAGEPFSKDFHKEEGHAMCSRMPLLSLFPEFSAAT
jgi:hypothetical protein